MSKKLTKGTPDNSFISGVCSGLSDYFEIDATIIRFICIIAALFHGIGIIFYFILAIIMPDKD